MFETLPSDTHLDFEIAISSERIDRAIYEEKWGYCYFRMKEKTNLEQWQKKINTDLAEMIRKSRWGEWQYGKAQVHLQPLANIAFDHFRGDVHSPKSRRILTTFSFFARVALLMAWVNYINLTISLNSKRAKELVARKSAGARATDFAIQFTTEAILIHVIAILISFTIVQLVKMPIRYFLHLYIQEWNEISATSIFLMILLLGCSVLLTSLYPVIITLKLSPKNLFGYLKGGTRENRLNYVLTTFQFSMAITLIICIFSVNEQNTYILEKDIGLNTEQVLISIVQLTGHQTSPVN